MPIRIGINGFGRIGRYLLRLIANDPELQVVVINARADNENIARLFKYDSVHRTFQGDVSFDDDGIIINGRHIAVSRAPIGEWPWKKYAVDVVMDCSGALRTGEGLAKHIECGAKKVVLSAPGTGVDMTFVMGVNDHLYDPEKHNIISNASCTTNCLAPAVKALHESFGIKHGLITTIHSYTMGQRLLDGTSKDPRRGRAAALSMLPTSTGAARAIALVMPELEGKLDGTAIRVPTPNVSLVDLTCDLLKSATSSEEVNAALKEASKTTLKGILGFNEEPLVSCDYIGTLHAGIVDALSTKVIDKNLLKLIVWYDNESGFSSQMVRLLRMIAKGM